jgi:Bifunctional DNA primase/polymerase, N-terminal
VVAVVRDDSAGAVHGEVNGSEINDQATASILPRISQALLTADGYAGTRYPFLLAGPLYAAAGLLVLPLDADKKPKIKWGEGATNDPDSPLFRRFATAGIGIACKPSGLLVVDLDVKHPPVNGMDMWGQLTLASGDPAAKWACLYDRTTLIRTASGGLHLWFANPEGVPGRDDLLPGIDVKAAQGECGGYAVAPPTPGYSYLAPKLPMVVPGWLALPLTHKARPRGDGEEPTRAHVAQDPFAQPRRTGLSQPGRGDIGRRFAALIRTVMEAREGERNSKLHWSACRGAEMVRDGEVTREQVEGALTEAAVFAGLHIGECRDTIRSAFTAVGKSS